MKIMVNGMEKELVAIGNNDIEWTEDLLGNNGALHYDEDADVYTMTEDEFDWWVPVVEDLNAVQELENELIDDMDARTEREYRTAIEYEYEIAEIARIQREFLEDYRNKVNQDDCVSGC